MKDISGKNIKEGACVFLHKASWERIYLNLQLSVSGIPEEAAADKMDALSFYLVKKDTGRCAGVFEGCVAKDGFVHPVLNITNTGDNRMPGSGGYHIAVCDKQGSFLCYVKAGDAVLEKDGSSLYTARFAYQKSCFYEASLKSDDGLLMLFVRIKEKEKNAKAAVSDLKKSAARAYYNAMKLRFTKKRSRTVLFLSELSDEPGRNLTSVRDRMIERGLDKKYDLLVSARNCRRKGQGFSDSLKVIKKLSESGTVVLDDHVPFLDWLDPGKDTRFIQLWHAGVGFKATGYARWGHEGAAAPFSSHRLITYGITASEKTRDIFSELWGISKEQVIPCGIPRMDILFDEDKMKEAAKKCRKELSLSKDDKVILFAPTYRGRGRRDAHYPYEKLDLSLFAKAARESGYKAVIKLHPWVIKKPDIPAEFADTLIMADENSDINELFTIADLLITDYSSAIFEYSVFLKPMLFFAFDEEEYGTKRGFHRPYRENAPGKVVADKESLFAAIREGDFEKEKVEKYVKDHFDSLEGGARDRVIDWLIEGKLPGKYKEALSEKERRIKEWKGRSFPKP